MDNIFIDHLVQPNKDSMIEKFSMTKMKRFYIMINIFIEMDMNHIVMTTSKQRGLTDKYAHLLRDIRRVQFSDQDRYQLNYIIKDYNCLLMIY